MRTPVLCLHPETRFREAHRDPLLLHTYACGDFTLMAREHWLDLRGYAEFGRTPAGFTLPAPKLGAHTDEVLGSLR